MQYSDHAEEESEEIFYTEEKATEQMEESEQIIYYTEGDAEQMEDEMEDENKNNWIFLLDCGGTISAKKDENQQLTNAKGALSNALSTKLIRLNQSGHKICVVDVFAIDSSEITIDNWGTLNDKIAEFSHWGITRGIVVAHGTDTLAFTASAIAFGQTNLLVPVILVAAQFSILYDYTDGVNNLIGAVKAASICPPEVLVFMNHKLLMGTRITKSSATDIDSFETPTTATIATYTDDLKIPHKYARKMYWKKIISTIVTFKLSTIPSFDFSGKSVEQLKFSEGDLVKKKYITEKFKILFPQHESDYDAEFHQKYWSIVRGLAIKKWREDQTVKSYYEPTITMEKCKLFYLYPNLGEFSVDGAEGVLLVAYGAGNGPQTVKTIIKRNPDKLFAVCSVCPKGFVSSAYTAGLKDQNKNVACCGDMTVETSFVKLCVVTRKLTKDGVKQPELMSQKIWQMEHALHGEVVQP